MIDTAIDTVYGIVNSIDKTRLIFPGNGTIEDMIQFGFSFIEAEDHYVAHLVAHPRRMKDILCGLSDSVLDPDSEGIGQLWTAKLIVSKKVKENTIMFSNSDMSMVLILDVPNPHKIWEG